MNLILIGMPGCGKSSVGKLAAAKLKKRFIDIDEYIESKWGVISDLFKVSEEHFRNIETRAVKECSSNKNIVISTGGGIVTRRENIDIVKENGIIVFIDRPLDKIMSDVVTGHRPLLKEGKDRLIKLYEQRYDLYLKYSDIRIENDGLLEECVNNVIDSYNNNLEEKI